MEDSCLFCQDAQAIIETWRRYYNGKLILPLLKKRQQISEIVKAFCKYVVFFTSLESKINQINAKTKDFPD